MQTVSFVLDILLVIATITIYLTRPRIGGELAKGLQILTLGLMAVGLAHLAETVIFLVFKIDLSIAEAVHRVMVVIGFIFVIVGFNRMRKAFQG